MEEAQREEPRTLAVCLPGRTHPHNTPLLLREDIRAQAGWGLRKGGNPPPRDGEWWEDCVLRGVGEGLGPCWTCRGGGGVCGTGLGTTGARGGQWPGPRETGSRIWTVRRESADQTREPLLPAARMPPLSLNSHPSLPPPPLCFIKTPLTARRPAPPPLPRTRAMWLF